VDGTTFVLLRHGETALTEQKRFSGGGAGASDPDLSPYGRRQAERAAAALSVGGRWGSAGTGSAAIGGGGSVSVVLTSPLARCRQTAEVVAARLGDVDVRVEDGLRETAFGAWEGLTFAEAQDRQPAELDAWLASTAVPPPGGESFDEVAARVAATRDGVLARYPGRTVLLVTHVTPAKSLVRLALGAPPEAVYRMELAPASLSAVAYYPDGNASVRLLNDTGHLR
jgi:probable phosphoglycerate mutase